MGMYPLYSRFVFWFFGTLIQVYMLWGTPFGGFYVNNSYDYYQFHILNPPPPTVSKHSNLYFFKFNITYFNNFTHSLISAFSFFYPKNIFDKILIFVSVSKSQPSRITWYMCINQVPKVPIPITVRSLNPWLSKGKVEPTRNVLLKYQKWVLRHFI